MSVGLLLASCNFEDSATELFDPDPEFFNRPEQLAAGEFTQVHVDTSADGSFAVLAIEDETRLHILPLGGAPPCTLESVQLILPAFLDTTDDDVRTQTVVPYYTNLKLEETSEASPASLVQGANEFPWLTPLFDGSLTGALKFSDFNCQALEVETEETGPPYYLFDEQARRPSFLVESIDKRLLSIDPWRDSSTQLSDDGQILRLRRDADSLLELWTLEDGTLTVRNSNLEATAEFGEDVSEVAFREPDVFAVSAGELVRLPEERFDNPISIDDDACALDAVPSLDLKSLLDIAGPADPLTYYSPCNDRRLAVLDVKAELAEHYDSDVDYVLYATATDEGPWVAYLTEVAQDEFWGTGWLALPNEEPERLGDSVAHAFPLFEADTGVLFGQAPSTETGRALVLDDYDGDSGTLKLWEDGSYSADYAVEDLDVLGALFVARIPPIFPVYEVRDTGEQLFLNNESGELVPLEELEFTPDNTEFDLGAGFLFNITDVEQLSGTLFGLDRDLVLAEDVRFVDIVVLESIDAAVFISDFDPDAEKGTLKVFKQGFDQPAIFDRNVNSVTLFFTGYDNQSGILYTVTGSERAGIWFAATR